MSSRTRNHAWSDTSFTPRILVRLVSGGAHPLATAGLILLMRDLLAKGIFPPLTGNQEYIVILTIVGLTYLLAAASIVSRLRTRRCHRRSRLRAAGRCQSTAATSQAHDEKGEAVPLRRDTPRRRTGARRDSRR